MKISIGSDHRGYGLKQTIIKHFSSWDFHDVGTHSEQRTDFPVYAQQVCHDILSGVSISGILICGSGAGVAIAANRFKGIYAALAWNIETAQLSKEHDNANVLALPSDFISPEQAFEMITAWSQAHFNGGTYKHRLELIDQ